MKTMKPPIARTINKIRSQSKILSDLEKEGKVKFVGAIYDISNGKVTFLK